MNGNSHYPSHFKQSVQLQITWNIYNTKCDDLYKKKSLN